MSRGWRRRGLNADDAALWRRFVRDVSPLSERTGDLPDATPELPVSEQRMVKKKSQPIEKAQKPATTPAYRPPQSVPRQDRHAAPRTNLESGLLRRISRDHRHIDAAIDLHGMRQDEAHMALDVFIRQSAMRGLRVVMVITGKGRADGGTGVLRRAVPKWLATPTLAPFVVGYTTAHRHRGGDGAIYIQLRRKDRIKS